MKGIMAAVFGGACALAMMASAASAEISCNRDGDCWHSSDVRGYKPEFGISVHPDNWKWGDHDKYRWREHEGRGYWRGGSWVEIR